MSQAQLVEVVADRLEGRWHARLPEEVLAAKLPASAVALYAALALHDGRAGCFPSQRRLAGLLGWSERTVRKWVAFLAARDLVEVIERRGRGGYRTVNAYVLRYSPWSQLAARSCRTEHALDPPPSSSDLDQRPAEQLSLWTTEGSAIGAVVALLERRVGPVSDRQRALVARLVRSPNEAPGSRVASSQEVPMPRTSPSRVERALIARGRQKLAFDGGRGLDPAEREACETWPGELLEHELAILRRPVAPVDPSVRLAMLEELRAGWAEQESKAASA